MLQQLSNFSYKTVAQWLSNTDTVAGAALHIGHILTTGTQLGGEKFGYTDLVSRLIGSNPGYKGARVVNKIAQVLSDCNIEGVLIKSDKVTVDRSIDISESATILQRGANKEYNVDNAVPHLKQWNVSGYITSLKALGLDWQQVVKPSLPIQLSYLDACAVSRRPVWFKDNTNTFQLVLISNISGTYNPDAMNAIQVSISLTEYKPLYVESTFESTISFSVFGGA